MNVQRLMRRARDAVVVSTAGVLLMAVLPTAASAAVAVTGTGTFTYGEQDPAMVIGTGVQIADGTSYDGKYVDFEITGATSDETLSLLSASTPDVTAGAVSVVGSSVYLGDGTGASPIGSLDATYNGQAGQKLRVNMTTDFENSGFETGDLTGWTPMNQFINLGVTTIAGFTSPDTATYPGASPDDNAAPEAGASYSTTVTTDGQPTEGTRALRLLSTMRTTNDCDVVHGPAVYSGEFEAGSGDTIYFDWRAFSGGDAYHVFGYIQDRNGVQTEVLDTYTSSTSDTSWATKATVIPADGFYRFIFVSGTYDATCGRAAGASLLIDNVRVLNNKVTDTVLESLIHQLTYANSSDNPAATRTVSVTAESTSDGVGSADITVNINGVDDAPTIGSESVTFTNTQAVETFAAETGTFTGADVDGPAITFGIQDGVAASTEIDGVTYDQYLEGDYGTLYVQGSTGAYRLVADDDAINAETAGGSDVFTITASSGALVATNTFTATVNVPASVTSAPVATATEPGNGEVELTWDAPEWSGGSAISGYRIEQSTDGTTWTDAVANTGSVATSASVSGLTNGTQYSFRISAINATGTSVASNTITGTPGTVPLAPSITSLEDGPDGLELVFAAPTDDGGYPIDGYQVSTDGGVTWSETQDLTPGEVVVLDGLVKGQAHEVQVRAVNAAGIGPDSAGVAGTHITDPGAPAITGVKVGNRKLELSFTPPADSGGLPILGYQYSIDGGTTWSETTDLTSPFSVFGLENDVTYPLALRAVTAEGVSPAGTNSGTPGVVPVTPDIDPEQFTVPQGEGEILSNEQPLTVEVEATEDEVTVRASDGFAIGIAALGEDKDALSPHSSGYLLLEENGWVRVNGEGFAPNSLADVWMFSTPTFIGEVTVGDDGTFSQLLALPEGIKAGAHTLQLNGLSTEGDNRTASVGVVVLANSTTDVEPAELAYTGVTPGRLVLTGNFLLLLGAGLLLLSNRPQVGMVVSRPKNPVR